VAHQEEGEIVSAQSLARNLHEVQSCIPLWAAEEVLTTSAQFATSKRIGSGRICFGLGCTGQLGSNVLTFRVLTKCLIEILLTTDEDSLQGLITRIIRDRR
jgi:hypothetical protein